MGSYVFRQIGYRICQNLYVLSIFPWFLRGSSEPCESSLDPQKYSVVF